MFKSSLAEISKKFGAGWTGGMQVISTPERLRFAQEYVRSTRDEQELLANLTNEESRTLTL